MQFVQNEQFVYNLMHWGCSLMQLGVETLGRLGASAKEFLGDLTKRLVHVTGDLRSGEYFCQRLSLALLRGNVGSILGSVAQASRDSVLSIGVALGEVGVLGEVPRRER